MSNYKRIYLPNQLYFFTVVTANRQKLFASNANVEILKSTLRYVQAKRPFSVVAICVLPDHLHCIWAMAEDCNHSLRWQMLKTQFSRQFRHKNPQINRASVWQPRYWEHMIRDENDLHRHLDYIHYNPVKHGLVRSVEDWPYSSFSKFKQQGLYEQGWGMCAPDNICDMELE